MKIKTQDVSNTECFLWLELEDEIRYNHEWWIAIDTSDDALLRMMADTWLVRSFNRLSIDFDHEWEQQNHIVSYKTIKTIQHNQNDYTFIFTN